MDHNPDVEPAGGRSEEEPGNDPVDPPAGGTESSGTDALDRAMALVAYLRVHCPWDRAQTPTTLIPHLIEEAHEVVDAIRTGESDTIEDELGDLLLNLAFQLVIGEEDRAFDRQSVWKRLEAKMKRRHPHLFETGRAASWEEVKALERDGEPRPALDGVPASLPSLVRAFRLQQRAARVGFDWEHPEGALEKVREETDEVAGILEGPADGLREELGDLLFAVVNLTRLAGVDPDDALSEANRKFVRRFEIVEDRARELGLAMPGTSLEVLDGLWDEAKAREANGSQGEAQGAGTSTDEARPREAQGSADESRTPESDGSGRRSDQ